MELQQDSTTPIYVWISDSNLRCHLRKEFPEPEVQWVRVPMSSKKSVGRSVQEHPLRLPSAMIRDELSGTDPATLANLLERDSAYRSLYDNHPVTREAMQDGLPVERIVPLSVYFDGVQYTQNENFLGFYITNLRTRKLRLVWLLRVLASRSEAPQPKLHSASCLMG